MKLRPAQREDVEAIKAAGGRALIASSMGTGKSGVAICFLAESAPKTLPALVVAPASVVKNWQRECKMWAPWMKSWVFPDTVTKPPRPLGPHLYIISWDLLRERVDLVARMPFKTIVADEAHMGKNEDAQRTQALMRVMQGKEHLLCLTGTPVINNEKELNFLKSLIRRNENEEPLIIRRYLEIVAKDIPEKKRAYLPVDLPDYYRRIYDKADAEFTDWLRKEKEKLSQDGFAEVEIERSLAAEALVKIGYLRRIAGEGKVRAALDWVSRAVRLGEPVVVFAEHKPVIKRISIGLKKQRIRHVILDGSANFNRRQEAIDAFQSRQVPVFIGSKAAMTGITLHAARHLLFVERFYTSAEEEQAEDRIRRIGQRFETTIWFLHARNTIDDRLDQIVRIKRKLVAQTIGAVKTADTPQDSALTLMRTWGEHVEFEGAAELGKWPDIPALPPARRVRAIVFKGSRWKRQAALAWCQMNGYAPISAEKLEQRYQVNIQPVTYFVPNSFAKIHVARDLYVIVGKRRHYKVIARLRELQSKEL